MRALVTGGCGFIGSHVVERLVDEGWSILIVDNLSTGVLSNLSLDVQKHVIPRKISSCRGEILDFKPEFVFHLAAMPRIQPSFEDPIAHDKINVHETLSLIEIISRLGIKGLIYSSSSSCYGEPRYTPTSESHPIDPLNPYAIQKYSAERYVHVLCRRHLIPAVSLRYFNVYGPRSYNKDSPDSAYSSVIGIFKYMMDKSGYVFVTGDGKQRRDFIHAKDVADANLFAAKHISRMNGEVYNVGYGATYSINEVASLMGAEVKYSKARMGEASVTHADIRRIQEIGWSPRISLEAALLKQLI
jgi:UDP-glucose 4-epimerase